MISQHVLNPKKLDETTLIELGKNSNNLRFYNYKNESNQTLCLGESDLKIKGCIRFDDESNQFQGYNGTEWINFNAEKGEQGEKGDDFLEKITLINQGSTSETGNLFVNTNIDLNDEQELKIKSIHPSQYCQIENNIDHIKINPLPQPYNIHIPSSISLLKGQETDILFKAFGDVSIYCVAPNNTIQKGQACRLVNINDNLYIEPFTYQSRINKFKDNTSYCGIALENGEENQYIKICTRGITTTKWSETLNEYLVVVIPLVHIFIL